MRVNSQALFKLAHGISSQRCLLLKTNDLTGHTLSRGGPFCRLCQQLYQLQYTTYSLSSCCFGSQDCVICATSQRCRLKNMQQPRERKAPWQLNNPYNRNLPDPLLLIVNIWNSRKATVFHLRRKLHFKQQGGNVSSGHGQ